jgi:hypothetical protein
MIQEIPGNLPDKKQLFFFAFYLGKACIDWIIKTGENIPPYLNKTINTDAADRSSLCSGLAAVFTGMILQKPPCPARAKTRRPGDPVRSRTHQEGILIPK